MFDLVTGKATHTPYTPVVPMIVSTVTQLTIIGVLIVIPWLYMTDQLPAPSTMMAFVAAPPQPPAPPPPPPPPDRVRAPETKPVATASTPAPVEAPSEVRPEASVADYGDEELHGVEGGVPTGLIGGIVGGLEGGPPPPPPPPPPPSGPIRIGGVIKEPALVYRVEPVYPGFAVSANIEGTVILEAIVDREGRVETLKVLRSIPLLDNAAMEAVRQWRYSPVVLNGKPERFILTVVVTFHLDRTDRRGR